MATYEPEVERYGA